MADINHGTTSAYANDKCRCDSCRSAWADYAKRHRSDKARAKRYEQTYDLKMETFLGILLRQGDRCGICKRPRDSFKRDFFVDHDHTTGAVRGLLCPGCNAGLGLLGNSVDGMINALEYLRIGSDPVVIEPEWGVIEGESTANGLNLDEPPSYVWVGPNQ